MEIVKNKEVRFESSEFLWRYLDLHRLLSFLLTKSLYFTRLDNFDDPLEGLTENTIKKLDGYERMTNSLNNLKPCITREQMEKIISDYENLKDIIQDQVNKSQKTQFANCWFINDKESFAMWNLYSNSESVAIKYHPDLLLGIILPSAESFAHHDFMKFVYGFVDYNDIWPFNYYQKSDKNIVYSAFKKDKSYIHEREFRFVVVTPIDCIGKYEFFKLPLGDIAKDDFQVIANPYMEDWKVENIKQLLQLFGIENKLKKSMLRVKKNFSQ